MNQMLHTLHKSRLFQGMDDAEITAFVQSYPCRIATFQQHDCIISRDDSSHAIGIVLEGTLGIYTDSFYGGHTLIGIGDQDYLFGFIAVFFNAAKSITTLYCRGPCTVAYFSIKPGTTPQRFIRQTNPKILANIYAMLAKHIHDDFDRMHIISSPSVRVRLARYLLYRYEATRQAEFDLLFNRTELADYLGLYRTSLSRELARLCGAGIISLDKSMLTIHDLNELIATERDSYER